MKTATKKTGATRKAEREARTEELLRGVVRMHCQLEKFARECGDIAPACHFNEAADYLDNVIRELALPFLRSKLLDPPAKK